ncbi:transcription termination factor 3, mitochondrial-like [Harpegnathos saltator]|uniref:mTERF domain-containing protein 1, mitochondrial n=1 Tax=Harpegnathos saltator TaxID=610380 RepID=E2C7C4_HARSA|nr:transcription termination factor 3, mitochondrial [Harpegnathos saltator]XP_025160497.1 transcription termination factor 3, mitochondrial-like [Harpegnathos saltator]EFN76111.1 mTERF domain-containing protein 1, mitochondrial [Harpegnathos saltator]
MLFRQSYQLLSAVRPAGNITTNLIARFISRNNRLQQCLSKENDKDSTDVKLSNPIALSEDTKKFDDGVYASHSTQNDNNVAKATSLTCAHPNITAPHVDNFLDDDDEKSITLPKPLDVYTEDLSDIGPYLTSTFSFAKYANKSRIIQELVKLGVELYKLESKEGMVQYILGLDFDRDVKPYITFLYDCGVPADYLGHFITKNPYIFKEDIDDLHTRIRYLRAHEFNINMIKTIICKNPRWLLHSTKDIDGRLSYFQTNFKLKGNEVRIFTVKGPKVVTYHMMHIMANTFSIKQDMEFNDKQMKQLLLRMPRLWVKNRERLIRIFEYVHDEMKLSHDLIVQSPHILLCRKNRLQQRHMFLVEMKKANYDPSKPLYVSPRALVSGTDVDFCRNIAKTSIDVYNEFLKTF